MLTHWSYIFLALSHWYGGLPLQGLNIQSEDKNLGLFHQSFTSFPRYSLEICVLLKSYLAHIQIILGTRTKLQLEILTIDVISSNVNFNEIILESSWSVSETTPSSKYDFRFENPNLFSSVMNAVELFWERQGKSCYILKLNSLILMYQQHEGICMSLVVLGMKSGHKIGHDKDVDKLIGSRVAPLST